MPEAMPRTVTLDEASQSLGTRIPLPTYLPENYAVQEVDLIYDRMAMLLISDKAIEKSPITDSSGNVQNYEITCKLALKLSWLPEEGGPGIKLPGERLEIKPTTGRAAAGIIYIPETGEDKSLMWQWWPDSQKQGEFEIVLSTPRRISNQELVKIAESLSVNY